jgi:hypothetical protein
MRRIDDYEPYQPFDFGDPSSEPEPPEEEEQFTETTLDIAQIFGAQPEAHHFTLDQTEATCDWIDHTLFSPECDRLFEHKAITEKEENEDIP